jgi:hypothetical protein
MDNNFQFSEKSMDTAWQLWFREWEGAELSESESEFVFLSFEAERFNQINNVWPTLAQVRDFAESRRS